MPGTEPRPRLTPLRQRVLDRTLDALLELAPVEREARMQQLQTTHRRAAAWLRRLLDAVQSDTVAFSTALDRVAGQALEAAETRLEQLEPGTRLGPWRIAELTGSGGMGLVYRADRADGRFDLQVAIKVMRRRHPGFAERLAAETRLLARLDHPGIARVIDGGETGDGCPYMVMDWVSGHNLDAVVDGRRPTAGEVIALFEQIAAAVAHAHQRLVVHGDIKPANVRVADDRVVLLDFGIARIIEDTPGEDAGVRAFTPAFAAPEQRAGQPASTQTDVWALGALLRWMLGREQSGPEPVALARRADWNAVLARAMAEDPAARYSGVPALLADIEALKTGRVVGARRAGPLHRMCLWIHRHRLAATLGALVLVSLAGGIGAQVWQASIVAAERDVARFEAERSAVLREQLVLLFRDAVAGAESGDALSTRELLDRSAALAEQSLADDPETRAAVEAMLAELYIAMGDFASAEPLLRSFVDGGHGSGLLRAMGLVDLAQIELRQGASDKALALTDRALDILAGMPGQHTYRLADVRGIRAQALRGLGRWDEAVATFREALAAVDAAAPESRSRARLLNNLGATLVYAGRGREAIPVLREALELWRRLGLGESSDAVTVLTNLASLEHQQGRLDAAEPLYRQAIEIREQRFGASGALGAAYLNYGQLLGMRYRVEPAVEHTRRGMALIARFEGEDGVGYARAMLNHGRVLLTAGDPAAADWIGRARRRSEALLGPDHLFTLMAGMHAARAERDAARAVAQLEGVVEALDAQSGGSPVYRAEAWCELARARIEAGPGAAALAAAGKCLALREAHFEPGSWMLHEARALEAAARIASGERAARAGLAAAREGMAGVFGAGHPRLRWCDRFLDA